MSARRHILISKPGRHDTPAALLCRPWCGMVKDEKTVVQGGAPLPVHQAEALTAQGSTAQIVLDGQVYTLRITRGRKLILTK